MTLYVWYAKLLNEFSKWLLAEVASGALGCGDHVEVPGLGRHQITDIVHRADGETEVEILHDPEPMPGEPITIEWV